MTATDATSPFQTPIFRNVWIASLASNFGGLIQSVGAAWLMTSIAKSADMVALVQTATALPILLWSLIGGALADGHDRRKIMLAAQVFMLLVSLALAAFGLCAAMRCSVSARAAAASERYCWTSWIDCCLISDMRARASAISARRAAMSPSSFSAAP